MPKKSKVYWGIKKSRTKLIQLRLENIFKKPNNILLIEEMKLRRLEKKNPNPKMTLKQKVNHKDKRLTSQKETFNKRKKSKPKNNKNNNIKFIYFLFGSFMALVIY
jgi:hypothetical protein